MSRNSKKKRDSKKSKKKTPKRMSPKNAVKYSRELLGDYKTAKTAEQIAESLGKLDTEEDRARVLSNSVELERILRKKKDLHQRRVDLLNGEIDQAHDELKEILIQASVHLLEEDRKLLMRWVDETPGADIHKTLESVFNRLNRNPAGDVHFLRALTILGHTMESLNEQRASVSSVLYNRQKDFNEYTESIPGEERHALSTRAIQDISDYASCLRPNEFDLFITWIHNIEVDAFVDHLYSSIVSCTEKLPEDQSGVDRDKVANEISMHFVDSVVEELRETTTEINEGSYESIMFFVGCVPVNLANLPNPQPVFPVIELICRDAIVEPPEGLLLDIAKSGKPDMVDVILRDPFGKPTDPVFYVGYLRMSDDLKVFDMLRNIWGHFYFRISHDPKRFDLISRKETVHVDPHFYPSPGVYYRDYQVFDGGLSDGKFRIGNGAIKPIHSRIHLMIQEVVDNATKHGEKKFINEVVKAMESSTEDVKRHVKRVMAEPLIKIGGPLPWKVQQVVDFRINKKRMLKNYHRIMDELLQKSEDSSEEKEERNSYRVLWTKMRNARQYEFTPESFYRIDTACEEHALQDVLGSEYADAEELYMSIPPDDFVNYAGSVMADLNMFAAEVPFPDRLPFDWCYFGWGPGVKLRGRTLSFLGLGTFVASEHQNNWDEIVLLGQLVSHDGYVVNFYDVYVPSEEVVLTVAYSSSADKGWVNGSSLDPWRVNFIVGEILSHATVIEKQEPTASDKNKFAKMVKRAKDPGKPIPPDYYTVYVRDRRIKPRLRKISTGAGSSPTYRHDVEGHPRLYYYRGELPIPEDRHNKLTKRGYTFYRHGDLIPADLYDLIQSRGKEIPKRGEWIAVKKTFIEPHVSPKNPELPYVPAVRKTTKGMTSTNYREEDEPTRQPDRPSH